MRWLLALFLCCAACRAQSFTLSGTGAQVVVHADPFSLSVRDAHGVEVLATLPGGGTDAYGAPAATLNRWRWEQQILGGWDGFRAHEGPWTRSGSAEVRSRQAGSASLRLGALDLDVSVEGARVRLALQATADGPNELGVSFKLGGEHFFGLGERFTSVDHRGLSLYSWAEEGGTGAGEAAPAGPQNPYPNGPSMTYFPVPFVLSSGGYAVRLEGSARSEFHLGSERGDAWRVAAMERALVLDVYVHADPLQSIDDFTAEVGRPPLPAPWVFGPRREVGPGDLRDGVPEWQALRARRVPTTALDDNTHFLPARSELGREDQLRAWTATVHAAGFKVLGYATPYVSMSKASAADDLAAGLAQGVFVKAADGSTLQSFFSSGEPQTLATIDLTNPAGAPFFQSLLQRALDLGYDGWMHDFGEYLPPDARLFDGRDGLHAHNDFPLLSARAAFELLERERPGDYLFFVRSGWAGTGGVVPGVWSGDPEATFDETQGLPANLRAGLNLSMSGAPYWGSDIGGYKCLTDAPNDKEMFLRWAALGAASPLMMNDTACATLGARKTKWDLWSDDETVAAYGALARLHTRLAPYFQALAVEAHRSGRPLMLHPFLLFPERAEALAVDDAFFLGPALFAAPVVRRGQLTKSVWLPPGRYLDLRDRTLHEGDAQVSLPALPGELPLLLAAGQLLPLLDASVETLAAATDPAVVTAASVADRLDVVAALSPGQSARLQLADGTELVATRGADAGNPGALAAADEAALPGCARCFREDGPRLRANGAADLVIRDLTLHTSGASRRIRWDVTRLP